MSYLLLLLLLLPTCCWACGDDASRSVCAAGGVTRLFAVRHGQRHDHLDPTWAATASRPHDPPLSEEGRRQAEELGRYLQGLLAPGERMTVYASPMVRTVQTAAGIVAGLGARGEGLRINVETYLAENHTSVRDRMLRTHRGSVPRRRGVFQGVARPVLLSPGDLLLATPLINLSYTPVVPVSYSDETGWELDPATSEPRTMQQRLRVHMPDFLGSRDHQGATLLLVTHAGVVSSLLGTMSGTVLNGSVACGQVFEMRTGALDDSWNVTSSWRPGEGAVGLTH